MAIPLFIYQGANQGEQPGQTGNYFSQSWTVTTTGSLVGDFDPETAMNLLLNHDPIQIGEITSSEQRTLVDAFVVELNKRKLIAYLEQTIAAYRLELNNLLFDNNLRMQEITQLIESKEAELAQVRNS